MKTTRLEAFSDGVLAIILTIMVLEMKVPHGTELSALRPLIPVFGSYIMSFAYIGIYWNNHHHLMHLTENINGKALWANLHLLFWLSLIPFVTGWMGENHFAELPRALYGIVLLLSGFSWLILQKALISGNTQNARLKEAIGRDFKGKISSVIYAFSVCLAFYQPYIALVLYVAVAVLWFVPDRRFEKAVIENS